MSDEAHFYLNGHVNKPNCRIWESGKPQALHERPLHGSAVTAWCNVTMHRIIVPFFFEDEDWDSVMVTGELYKEMKEHLVFPRLKEIKLPQGLWCQQDGTMPLLRSKFKRMLILRWPSRSPDLTLPDYYL